MPSSRGQLKLQVIIKIPSVSLLQLNDKRMNGIRRYARHEMHEPSRIPTYEGRSISSRTAAIKLGQ